MKVSLVDVDGHHFPNLALMKISAWHKSQGDTVDWYSPLFSQPDRIYASKVFTFTPDYTFYAATDPEPLKGGTGYDIKSKLRPEIDNMLPDYSIYPQYKHAIGFLSRGCIRNCDFCLVREKEGYIHAYNDIERISSGRNIVVLMDNNFLANEEEFIREQLEKAISMKLRIDFNQGLDCRLITDDNARLLSKIKWSTAKGNHSYIRFSCDHISVVNPLQKAIKTLRGKGYKGEFFIYFLAKDVDETLERINRVLEIDRKIKPFVMPFRAFDNNTTNKELQRLARWCNMASIRNTCSFKEYNR